MNENNENSTEQALKLTLGMFGTLEEVYEMAKIEREAHSYKDARMMLKELINKPLKSRAGIEATVSNNSIEKILSGKAIDKSFDRRAHLLAAANLEKLFSHAIEPFSFSMDAGKSNENYRAVHRCYAPMIYDGRIIPIKFTVMEMLNKDEGKRIYSLEAIEVDLNKKI
jgi:hypothetical protein